MVENTGLESLCSVANTPQEWMKELDRLFSLSFEEVDLNKRKDILSKHFDNLVNVDVIIEKVGVLIKA